MKSKRTTSKSKSRIDPRQMTIFEYLKPEQPPAPGSMNIDIQLRVSISEAIRKSGKERIDICSELYKLTGVEVAKSTLDSWSAESRAKSSDNADFNNNKRWGIPAEILTALCQATGDWTPLHILVEAANFKALRGKQLVEAKLGEAANEIKRWNGIKKELQAALEEAEE